MNTLIRWGKFNLVGAMGVVVQLAVLEGLSRVAPGHTLWATAAAVECALLHNFVWHLHYTWRDRREQSSVLAQLLRFHLSNGLVSLLGNLAADAGAGRACAPAGAGGKQHCNCLLLRRKLYPWKLLGVSIIRSGPSLPARPAWGTSQMTRAWWRESLEESTAVTKALAKSIGTSTATRPSSRTCVAGATARVKALQPAAAQANTTQALHDHVNRVGWEPRTELAAYAADSRRPELGMTCINDCCIRSLLSKSLTPKSFSCWIKLAHERAALLQRVFARNVAPNQRHLFGQQALLRVDTSSTGPHHAVAPQEVVIVSRAAGRRSRRSPS